MRLKIILSNDAHKALHSRGFLIGDRSRIEDDSFLSAYHWHQREMITRIPASIDADPWPLWAWFNRTEPFSASDGDWLVEFEKPDSEVLLSDYELWHSPLSGSFLPDFRASEDEQDAQADAWYDEADRHSGPIPQHLKDRLEESWRRIFDVDGRLNIQATFWKLNKSEILSERQLR